MKNKNYPHPSQSSFYDLAYSYCKKKFNFGKTSPLSEAKGRLFVLEIRENRRDSFCKITALSDELWALSNHLWGLIALKIGKRELIITKRRPLTNNQDTRNNNQNNTTNTTNFKYYQNFNIAPATHASTPDRHQIALMYAIYYTTPLPNILSVDVKICKNGKNIFWG